MRRNVTSWLLFSSETKKKCAFFIFHRSCRSHPRTVNASTTSHYWCVHLIEKFTYAKHVHTNAKSDHINARWKLVFSWWILMLLLVFWQHAGTWKHPWTDHSNAKNFVRKLENWRMRAAVAVLYVYKMRKNHLIELKARKFG